MAFNLTLTNNEGEVYTAGHAYSVAENVNGATSARWRITETASNKHPYTLAVIHSGNKIIKALEVSLEKLSNDDLEISWRS